MEDVIERMLESIITGLLSSFLSFIIANLFLVLFVVIFALFLFGSFIWIRKRSYFKTILLEIKKMHDQTSIQIDGLITSNTFKDLEKGLIQGETLRRMEQMEETLVDMHQQSEQLKTTLLEQRIPLFNLYDTYNQLMYLEDRIVHFSYSFNEMMKNISAISLAMKESKQWIDPAKAKFNVVSSMIQQMMDETTYPLTSLNVLLEQSRTQLIQLEQDAAFDVIKLKLGITPFLHHLDALHEKSMELQKNIDIFRKMQNRAAQEQNLILDQINHDPAVVSTIDLKVSLGRIEMILHRLDQSIRSGESVQLRKAASDMEYIFAEIQDRIENAIKK